MDELTVALKAREFVSRANPIGVPVSMDVYAEQVGATIKVSYDLGDDEDGFSAMKPSGKFGICINGNQKKERQRFTVCHELAHIVLGLPSDHSAGPSWSYSKRTPNEILCDVFAAELLLPYRLFKPFVDDVEPSLAVVSDLAAQFEASLLASGSRFAVLAKYPAAFVLSEGGRIRYASRSAPLREAKAWIPVKADIPDGSLAKRCSVGKPAPGPEEVEVDVWFDDWNGEGTLFEDAWQLASYDQTISLLWFEEEVLTSSRYDARQREEEECGLAELDGILPWPGKDRRRR